MKRQPVVHAGTMSAVRASVRAAVTAVAMVAVLSGCTNGGGAALSSSATPIDGTPVTLAGGIVTSACFTFSMPTTFEYELNPKSSQCQTSVRIKDTDSLTEIAIGVQVGDSSLDTFLATVESKLVDNGATDVSVERVTVGGVPGGVAYFTNGWGLPTAFYLIPVTASKFSAQGQEITSFFVSGPVGSPDVKASMQEILDSFAEVA